MKVSGRDIVLTLALYGSLVFVTIKLVAMAISGMATTIMGWIK